MVSIFDLLLYNIFGWFFKSIFSRLILLNFEELTKANISIWRHYMHVAPDIAKLKLAIYSERELSLSSIIVEVKTVGLLLTYKMASLIWHCKEKAAKKQNKVVKRKVFLDSDIA